MKRNQLTPPQKHRVLIISANLKRQLFYKKLLARVCDLKQRCNVELAIEILNGFSENKSVPKLIAIDFKMINSQIIELLQKIKKSLKQQIYLIAIYHETDKIDRISKQKLQQKKFSLVDPDSLPAKIKEILVPRIYH